MGRLISSDPVTRTKTIFHFDNVNDEAIIETVADVEDVLEHNKVRSSLIPNKSHQKFKGEHFHMVASIPLHIYYALPKEMRDDEKALAKWLDDKDNEVFKTMPVKLSK